MRRVKKKASIITILFVLLSTCAFAAGNTMTATIETQPSSLTANNNYAFTYSVNDSANVLFNATIQLYTNSVNIDNISVVNQNSTTPSNVFTATFPSGDYQSGDAIYATVNATETSNSSVIGNAKTNSLTVKDSTTKLLASDTLQGLPSAGTALGDFMGNVVGGMFKFILLIGIGLAIVGLIVGIIYVMKTKASGGIGRR